MKKKKNEEKRKMGMPLSQEIRKKIIYHKENGEKNLDIAKWLLINERSVRRIWKQYQEEGKLNHKPLNRGRKAAFCQAKMNKIIDRIREKPDITLIELIEEFNLPISVSALCRKLKKIDLNYKKKRCFLKSRNAKTYRSCVKNGSNI